MSNKIAYIIELQNRFSAQAKKVAQSMKHIQNTAKGARADLKKMDSAAASTFKNMERNADRAGRAVDKLRGKYKGLPTGGGSRGGKFNIGARGRAMRDSSLEGLMYMAPAVYQMKRSLDVSSEVEETRQKYGHVFGTTQGIQASSDVDIKELAKYADESENKVREMYTSFGTFLTGQGFEGKDVGEMSKTLGLYSQELTVFHNAPSLMDTGDRLTRGLMGETESLKKLGIIVRQDDPAFQRRMKLLARSDKLTMSQARSQLILNEIMRQSKYALGHTVREMGNYATVLRRTESQLYDTQDAFGKVFKKDATNWVLSLKDVLTTLEFLDPTTKKVAIRLTMLAAGLLVFGLIVGVITMAIGVLATATAGTVSVVLLAVTAIMALGIAIYDSLLKPMMKWMQSSIDKMKSWIGDEGIIRSTKDWLGISDARLGGGEWMSAPDKLRASDSWGDLKGKIQVSAAQGSEVKDANVFFANMGVNMIEAL